MKRSLSASVLTWLRAFESVARHRSFTRAAEELAISQSAVSQQVHRLEEYLGLKLVERRPGSTFPTTEGTRLFAVASDAFDGLKTVIADISAPHGAVPITLSCSPSFAIRWITPRLGKLRPNEFGVDIRVFGEFHELTPYQMANEQLQAAIRYDFGKHEGFEELRFLDEYLVPVASPEFVRRHPEALSPQGLRGGWLLHDAKPWAGSRGLEEWQTWLAALEVDVSDFESGRRFNMAQLAVNAAVAGEGVALGRLALVLEELESGKLVALLPTAVKSQASYCFLAPLNQSRNMELIKSWLCAQASEFVINRTLVCKRLGIHCSKCAHVN